MDLNLGAKTTALVVIDLQNGLAGRQLAPHAFGDVVSRSRQLADALRSKGGMVVWVHVLMNEVLRKPTDVARPGAGQSVPAEAMELVAGLGVQPEDGVVAKRQFGAFYGTALEQLLRRRGIETVVMAGVATNFGVESTARAAMDHGFTLVFAEDAMSSVSEEMHRFAVEKLFPLIGRVRWTEEIVAGL